MITKERPHRVKAYDQLVRNSVLQDIYDRLSPYGYNIEFIYTEDLEDKESYKEGREYALMRDTRLIELIRTSPLLSTKKKIKDFTDRTIVIAFNVSGMSLNQETMGVLDRSNPKRGLNLCTKDCIVGYTYAKIEDQGLKGEWEKGEIKEFPIMIPKGVEILEIDPIAKYVHKEGEATLGEKPREDAVTVSGSKEKLSVNFKVSLNLMMVSESVQKEVNFILLRTRCGNNENKRGVIRYEFFKNQPFHQPFSYNLNPNTEMRVMGGKNSRMYALSEEYEVTNAPLFSELTRYVSSENLGEGDIEVLLKLGTLHRQ